MNYPNILLIYRCFIFQIFHKLGVNTRPNTRQFLSHYLPSFLADTKNKNPQFPQSGFNSISIPKTFHSRSFPES